MLDLLIVFKNVICTSICLLIVRVFIVYLRIHNSKKKIAPVKASHVKIMIVLGSGGHTFEMIHLMKNINGKFSPRIYIIADSDKLSEQKLKSFEDSKITSVEYCIEKICRSREVNQSWLSTVFTTLKACVTSIRVLLRHKPELILCNGPGTCVPICGGAFLLHVLGLKHIKIVYVESICRVKSLSLSGKILYFISDYFLVQWPQLKEKYPRVKYLGKLI